MSSSPADISLTAPSSLELALGRRIAHMRTTRGLTLDRLAQMTGFTKGYLSKIENSKVIPPIGTLIGIARELDAEVSDLLQNAHPTPQAPVSIVRSDQRERVFKGGASFGYDYVALAGERHDKHMEPFIMLFQEHVDKDIHFEHEGEELMFVLSGQVEFEAMLDSGLKRWVLSVGDCAYFDSHIPHRGRSLGGESEVLVVIYRTRPA